VGCIWGVSGVYLGYYPLWAVIYKVSTFGKDGGKDGAGGGIVTYIKSHISNP